MSIKLDLYRVFWMVGKYKSFSKAAGKLFMTQPAVSQSIQQLESELGTRLFNRTSKGVTFTEEGSLLYEYVHSSLSLIDTGEEKILEFKNLTAGELKIGVGDTISRHFLLPFLEKFHSNYPNIKFKIENGTTAETLAMLKSGEVDIAVCNLPVNDPALEVMPCMEIQDIFVCGEKYKRLLRKPLQLEQLVRLPLIFLEPNSNSRKYVDQFLEKQGVDVSPEFELGYHDLLLDFAKINLGIACVTREFSKEYLNRGYVWEIPLEMEIPKRSIGVCYLQSVPLSSASTKFVELIERGTTYYY
ncbi:DNA-binding transcriptional LysR family regulator [Gracilibacillus halotolerans]|uniref:DNA-binding transcriptional LysR family regulator n=1 Tax=Gracilibacillus halotolerans TaxID=74386 RepID=A0A841REK0_9BACI|nr:LysR family transcriptional regulator [Gracilibacillus halotolerans]MBB6512450.1 DNA-binding transcriptional LysR family regulator [Gracilibacillus halotolerans]